MASQVREDVNLDDGRDLRESAGCKCIADPLRQPIKSWEKAVLQVFCYL
jgi:hypothetical protein